MTVELLKILSVVSYVIAGIFFAVSVILFFVLDIPESFGFLSGLTAKKAIASNKQNNGSNSRQKKNYAVPQPSEKKNTAHENTAFTVRSSDGTAVLENGVNSTYGETVPLAAETAVLETEPTGTDPRQTGELYTEENGTVVLDVPQSGGYELTVDVEYCFYGSREIIE